jgi:hypothetical protein
MLMDDLNKPGSGSTDLPRGTTRKRRSLRLAGLIATVVAVDGVIHANIVDRVDAEEKLARTTTSRCSQPLINLRLFAANLRNPLKIKDLLQYGWSVRSPKMRYFCENLPKVSGEGRSREAFNAAPTRRSIEFLRVVLLFCALARALSPSLGRRFPPCNPGRPKS